jgi:hypothetical protein
LLPNTPEPERRIGRSRCCASAAVATAGDEARATTASGDERGCIEEAVQYDELKLVFVTLFVTLRKLFLHVVIFSIYFKNFQNIRQAT